MFFKLSLKNVKKSFDNYTLYFLTLTFGVCIFYVFNSIEAQKSMMKVSASTEQMMVTITKLMGITSVFISFILGFLIVYANNFLIRRRKKEIGIYMTLGMDKTKVARILIIETLIIGILSLGVGLLTGIFLSQGLSVVTAKLFEVEMTAYKFIFSKGAFIKTIIYFGIIFVIVMLLSVISISKYKLIDLIYAEKKNEKPRLKNTKLSIGVFIISIACLAVAYKLVLKNGIQVFDKRLLFEIILGSIGTFLFFASLSGFFLKLIQSNKKYYYRGLNTFILRQFNSRINTTFISISFICLMLFFTIGTLSTGLGLTNALNKSYNNSAPYDVSFECAGEMDINNKLQKFNINLYNYTDKFLEYAIYQTNDKKVTKGLILEKEKEYIPEINREHLLKTPLLLIKQSDYNELMKLQGKDTINLLENEVAIFSDYAAAVPELKSVIVDFIQKDYKIKISDEDYKVYKKPLIEGIVTNLSSNIILALVVPDKMVRDCIHYKSFISFDCSGNSKETQIKLENDLLALERNFSNDEVIKINVATREMINSVSAGLKAIIYFLAIYVGIIFLITSAATLALQQLSDAADNKHRYCILQKIGADENLLYKALFKQIAIYFLLPLLLACIHSIVGIKVANDTIKEMGGINALSNIIITAVLVVFVYGSYFIATYFGSKRIIIKHQL